MQKPYDSHMKKLIPLMLVFILAISLSSFASANEGFGYTVDSSVRLNRNGTAEFDIHVTGVDEYAGAQFELILGEGVSIESIAFDKGAGFSTIPPTYARGSHFFSLIAGTNEYEGDFTCTVEILYEGTEPVQIIIAEIQTYFIIEPGNVETSINDTRSVINILPYGYIVIGEDPLPLARLARDWMWPIIAGVAVVFIILITIIMRQQRKIIAAKAFASDSNANKAEKEMPEQTRSSNQDTEND